MENYVPYYHMECALNKVVGGTLQHVHILKVYLWYLLAIKTVGSWF